MVEVVYYYYCQFFGKIQSKHNHKSYNKELENNQTRLKDSKNTIQEKRS